jgi:hypothetical protein
MNTAKSCFCRKVCPVVVRVAVGSPTLPDSSLVYLVAAWALITGAFEIARGFRLRRHVTGELLLALSGGASSCSARLWLSCLSTTSPSWLRGWICMGLFSGYSCSRSDSARGHGSNCLQSVRLERRTKSRQHAFLRERLA